MHELDHPYDGKLVTTASNFGDPSRRLFVSRAGGGGIVLRDAEAGEGEIPNVRFGDRGV